MGHVPSPPPPRRPRPDNALGSAAVTNIPVLLEFVRHVSPKPSLAELDRGRKWLDEKVAEHYKLILKRKGLA